MVERLIVMVVLIVVVGVYISPRSPCARPPPFCRCLARSPYSNDPLFVNLPLSVGRFLAGLNLAGLINSCARFVGVVDTDREPYQASTNRLLCTCTHTTSTTKRDQWVPPPAAPLRHRQRRGPLRGRPVRCPLFCRLSCRHQYRPLRGYRPLRRQIFQPIRRQVSQPIRRQVSQQFSAIQTTSLISAVAATFSLPPILDSRVPVSKLRP